MPGRGEVRGLDLTVRSVPNDGMRYLFEERLGRFSEMSIETAGEHSTPREVIRLMEPAVLRAAPLRQAAWPAPLYIAAQNKETVRHGDQPDQGGPRRDG